MMHFSEHVPTVKRHTTVEENSLKLASKDKAERKLRLERQEARTVRAGRPKSVLAVSRAGVPAAFSNTSEEHAEAS